jgi:limonene 1,2-monooxygenase
MEDTNVTRDTLRAGVFMPPWLLPLSHDPTLEIRRQIDMISFLDDLGWDEAWVGEHHSGGQEIIASPELLMAAAIERTNRIRIGAGVISLPYHHPLTVADRIVQLDHQARGRAMFGFGPGVIPADAAMLGVPGEEQRNRMAESIDVIVRLLAGEYVTSESEWFTLRDGALHLKPFSRPRPHLCVASAVTPSGGKLAGRYGFGLLCVAAASGPGYNVLDVNWANALEAAEANGQVMNRSDLRLVAPFHIAETRDQAIAEVRDGFERWSQYMYETSAHGPAVLGYPSLEAIIEDGRGAIGTAEDAVEVLESYWEKSGGFGCILYQVTNWANFAATKRSLELFTERVMPAFAGRCEPRFRSHAWAQANQARLDEHAGRGIQKAIRENMPGAKSDSDVWAPTSN